MLSGNSCDNVLAGGLGADLLIGRGGSDTLDGGEGVDTVTFAGLGAGVSANLSLSGAQLAYTGATLTLVGIENLLGSSFNDVLTGDANANRLDGGSGDDQLDGKGGVDTVTYANATSGVTVKLGVTEGLSSCAHSARVT